jgi:hypothetical protein
MCSSKYSMDIPKTQTLLQHMHAIRTWPLLLATPRLQTPLLCPQGIYGPISGLVSNLCANYTDRHHFCYRQSIMHPICPFSSLISLLLAYTAALDPHLQLPLYEFLVKFHVSLCSKQPLLDVDSLNTSMLARSPNVYLRALW